MGDLISRDEVIKELKKLRESNPHTDTRGRNQHNSEISTCIYRVCTVPTAYDPTKVVEQIKERLKREIDKSEINGFDIVDLCADVCNIVKDGGANG